MIQYCLLLLFFALAALPQSAEAQARVRRNVEIEWDPVEDAIGYEVQVMRKNENQKPTAFKTKSPNWSATIKPGLYLMQIRSFDERGVPGDWSPPSELLVRLPSVIAISPKPEEVVQATEQEIESITFQWEPVPDATKYRIKLQSGDWTSTQDTSDTKLSVSVPVGTAVQWQLVTLNKAGEEGDPWEVPQKFIHQGPNLSSPQIAKPFSKYIKEMNWSEVENAKSYSYDLKYFNLTTKKWEVIESKRDYPSNTIAIDYSKPTGKYRLVVQANGENRKPSKLQQLDFNMHGGIRDPAAFETAVLRESLVKPTNFYAIASYLITQVTYQSSNYDEANRPSFKALGGTGRIGIGYQNPESKWGAFGILDLSGFSIGGDNFTFSSLEAHATRKIELGQNGILLFGTGLFSKELPVILGSSIDGFRGTGKIRGTGPHAGFTYWTPFSDKYGLQLNARAYYVLTGSSDAGGNTQSSLSYQYGLLGSYRLKRSWMGYAGYVFRKDQMLWDTTPGGSSYAQEGQTNSITVDGHYLNLILEISF